MAEHRIAREKKILDATTGLLARGDQVTVTSIATEAGLPRSTVYEYVSSADQAITRARAQRFDAVAELARTELTTRGSTSREDFTRALQAIDARDPESTTDFILGILSASRTSASHPTALALIGFTCSLSVEGG